ncbi:hypothetical protein KVT40_005144 [Elsinoe batatas]|uniref:WD40 repeat-like protein n=1 Tax=Elsinoe batatas TaxID=2601811 RepID=A0A8K0PFA8_9PEZI|nr:hypothetical protein KVT40_005144 [Elsinoe batatas]
MAAAHPRADRYAAAQRSVSTGSIFFMDDNRVLSDGVHSISDGRGRRVASGTNAPLHTSNFFGKGDPTEERDMFKERLAVAFDYHLCEKILNPPLYRPSAGLPGSYDRASVVRQKPAWKDNAWTYESPSSLLDAPGLRDDYYCSLLSYCPTAQCLASEAEGVKTPESLTSPFSSHITSLSFSSEAGQKSILAIGRADGRVTLWNTLAREPCFDSDQPSPVSCVSFSPRQIRRHSYRDSTVRAEMEILAVGDEAGNIYVYAVEYPDQDERHLYDWHGALNILVRLEAHSQQVCGLAWSIDDAFLATGSNDNSVYIFELRTIFPKNKRSTRPSRRPPDAGNPPGITHPRITIPTSLRPARSYPFASPRPHIDSSSYITLPASSARHHIALSAAVKALSFSPWAPSLLALGAGSNDRGIHFHHALSGQKLAAIDCAAQVTSLTWSTTRREIAATFGFAQPDHKVRVAVYSWPDCIVRVKVEWAGEERALWGIAFRGGPEKAGVGGRGRGKWKARGRGRARGTRTEREGCLVVATSDASIKFHEVWGEGPGGARVVGSVGGVGSLGSEVLEEVEGFGLGRERGLVIR